MQVLFRWLAAAACIMGCLLAGAAHAETRAALVIGNGAYAAAGKLSNPTQDADAIGALFSAAGFDVVEVKHDLGETEMRRALRDFSDRARGADIAVVFFAGHGIEVDGTNYLVPVDAVLQRDRDVEDEAVPLERVIRALDSARRLRLVLLDACRANPFLRSMRRTTRAVGRGLAKIEVLPADTLIGFAAMHGKTALDGAGVNSPYTLALLKHLAAPGLDVQLALRRVRDEVLTSTGNRQEPFVYGSLGGAEIALVPAGHVPVAPPLPAPAPPPELSPDPPLGPTPPKATAKPENGGLRTVVAAAGSQTEFGIRVGERVALTPRGYVMLVSRPSLQTNRILVQIAGRGSQFMRPTDEVWVPRKGPCRLVLQTVMADGASFLLTC